MKKMTKQKSEENSLEVAKEGKVISSMIFTIRDEQVMLDSDLAMLYGVETRTLNQAVKRNANRFPEHYRFQLSEDEKIKVITNCDNPDIIKFGPVAPYVFSHPLNIKQSTD